MGDVYTVDEVSGAVHQHFLHQNNFGFGIKLGVGKEGNDKLDDGKLAAVLMGEDFSRYRRAYEKHVPNPTGVNTFERRARDIARFLIFQLNAGSPGKMYVDQAGISKFLQSNTTIVPDFDKRTYDGKYFRYAPIRVTF